MTRCYYAVLNDAVYIFSKRKIRERFCTEKQAKRIYAYERVKYRVHVDMSQEPKKPSKSAETVSADRTVNQTQNVVNRYVSDRQKLFKGQR